MFFRLFYLLGLTIFLYSCAGNKEIYEPSSKVDPYELYKEGLEAFERNDYFFANKKFSEAELNFDKPELAAKSALMSSYSLYGINFYEEAEENIKRFLKKYPGDKNKIYAHYLLAIVYFEQMSDEKKDLKPLQDASNQINFFLENYPDTDYAIDLKFKKDLINNQLASKELYIAKFYIETKKWVPAIRRLKNIVENFDNTIFVEEALHRLVEINFYLGLDEEATKYASILGYNYNSSEWYQQSYKILNKDYKIAKKQKKRDDNKKDGIFKKIINIIK